MFWNKYRAAFNKTLNCDEIMNSGLDNGYVEIVDAQKQSNATQRNSQEVVFTGQRIKNRTGRCIFKPRMEYKI